MTSAIAAFTDSRAVMGRRQHQKLERRIEMRLLKTLLARIGARVDP
jgi:hypothetical protein